MISLIIPSYNNLNHLKNAYNSILKHYPQAEVILMDDGSTDGTWEWIQNQNCIKYRSETRIGHTILYDKGIEMATNKIVGIFHADMIMGPNYIENLLPHLHKGKTVVCATRIEPPLHPPGLEKIVHNFGMDYDSLDIPGFESLCDELQNRYKGQTTNGMFAPWIIYKEDFQKLGGHDKLFAPFPYEDSDIFQRWILAGYKLIQSRDSFVYHLTCRGHRWNDEIGKDDDFYKLASKKAARNYIRKWGSWIQNNQFQHPIIIPKYDIGINIINCNLETLELLEPYCSNICIENENVKKLYINKEQSNTLYNLYKKIKISPYILNNDIVISLYAHTLNDININYICNLADIIRDSGSTGEFKLGEFKLVINNITEKQNDLIFCDNSKYL